MLLQMGDKRKMIVGQFSKQLASVIGSLKGGATEFEIRYRKVKGNPCIVGEPYLVPKNKEIKEK